RKVIPQLAPHCPEVPASAYASRSLASMRKSPARVFEMLLPRCSLLRLVLVAVALLGWCLPADAEQKPLFQEKFTGKLSAGWTWIDELPGTWQLVDESLDLKVVPVGEGLWASGRKHPNLLLRDPGTKGDFAVEVHLKSKPTSQFEHAGVLLY